MILFSKYLVPKGYTGITIYPFVFLRSKRFKNDVVLINHEKIHLKQQQELLVLPFYLIYLTEFVLRFCIYQNWFKAYRNISFEREAYYNQTNLNYLKTRSFWRFTHYFCKNDI